MGNELAWEIMNLCEGKKSEEVYYALSIVKLWVEQNSVIPSKSAIKNPVRNVLTNRIESDE